MIKIESEPKIIAFLCQWCSYSGADLAGTNRFTYPSSIEIVKVPCSGRIDPLMIFKAFVEGYDGVMVSGCLPGDCHYRTGNYHAKRKLAITRRLLETVGVHPDRMLFTWISAAQGRQFAGVCETFTERIKTLANTQKTLARSGVDT